MDAGTFIGQIVQGVTLLGEFLSNILGAFGL